MKHTSLGVMTVGWEELIPSVPTSPPEGYSSAKEIAKKINLAVSTTRTKLNKLYEDGKIDRVQVKQGRGLVYYYKD
jgi:DNA-binding transcriptional ArsR family regulator